jgi:hypothetical protein
MTFNPEQMPYLLKTRSRSWLLTPLCCSVLRIPAICLGYLVSHIFDMIPQS